MVSQFKIIMKISSKEGYSLHNEIITQLLCKVTDKHTNRETEVNTGTTLNWIRTLFFKGAIYIT